MFGPCTNVLAVTCVFWEFLNASPENINDSQKNVLESLLKDLQNLNIMLNFDPNLQTPVAETRSYHSGLFKRSQPVIPGIQNQLLKDLQIMNFGSGKSHTSRIFMKRGFDNLEYKNLRSQIMNPGLYKKNKDAEEAGNAKTFLYSRSITVKFNGG